MNAGNIHLRPSVVGESVRGGAAREAEIAQQAGLLIEKHVPTMLAEPLSSGVLGHRHNLALGWMA
jgi:hypothetical protein